MTWNHISRHQVIVHHFVWYAMVEKNEGHPFKSTPCIQNGIHHLYLKLRSLFDICIVMSFVVVVVVVVMMDLVQHFFVLFLVRKMYQKYFSSSFLKILDQD